MSAGMVLIVFFVLLALSVPIFGALGITSVFPSIVDSSFSANGIFLVREMLGGINSFPLLAIVMFILSGIIMSRGGVSRKLFNFFCYFLGEIPAGMPCCVIVTCLFYGAISGSAPATVAAVGSMTIPVLIELGYEKPFSTALVVVAGGLGVIIPPSIPFVLYCMATGESVGDMFIAGILPGILIAFCLMGYAIYYCKRKGENKEKIHEVVGELRSKGFLQVLKESIWALFTPVIILGSIYSGIASPTEAAVLSVIYALIISIFLYRTLKVSELMNIFFEAINTYAPMLFLIAAANGFARVLTLLRVPQTVSETILTTFGGNKVAILVVINLFLLVVGMLIDLGPAVLILAPIFAPMMTALGVDLIHFGIIMVVNLAIGFVTPPVGVNLYVGSRLSGVPVLSIAKNAVGFLLLFAVALAIIVIFPAISLVLIGRV